MLVTRPDGLQAAATSASAADQLRNVAQNAQNLQRQYQAQIAAQRAQSAQQMLAASREAVARQKATQAYQVECHYIEYILFSKQRKLKKRIVSD